MGASRSGAASRVRADIASAIDADEIAPLFQPIVDLRTGLVAGYEALSRFMRGSRDVAGWFADAHAVGLGPALEAHAIKKALEVTRRPFGAFLALNVSPLGLMSGEPVLPDRLDGIVLELTGQGSAPSDAVRAACQDVRARGGRIAVDLAGSDYAGLRELMLAAPDVLKLDRSLVHRIHLDVTKSALVGALVTYARELGIAVCGEGVESLADLDRLAELDVTYAQGYVAGRPARPWAHVDPAAAAACQAATAASVSAASSSDDLHGDRRLQWLTLRLSEATSYAELDDAVTAIEGELGADEIAISLVDGGELVVVRSAIDHRDTRTKIGDFPATERVLRDRESVQVIATDPDADPAAVELLRDLGHGSMLMLALTCAGCSIGLFEAYSRDGRPFGRHAIGRARIIALQLGATLERLSRG